LTGDGFEVYEYVGVEVEFVHGREAVLTIYHDGEEQEQVNLLQHASTKAELHELFQSKGFTRLSEEEIGVMKETRLKEREEERKRQREAALKRRKDKEDMLLKVKEERDLEEKKKNEGGAVKGEARGEEL
jgi:hypothetical protein